MSERETYFWLFFRLSGRVDRTVFVLSFLFLVAAVTLPFYLLLRQPPGSDAAALWEAVFSAGFIVTFWSSIAVSVKRLHDLGKPGILAVALVIPVVSVVAFFVLALWPGDPAPNAFGRRPNSPA